MTIRCRRYLGTIWGLYHNVATICRLPPVLSQLEGPVSLSNGGACRQMDTVLCGVSGHHRSPRDAHAFVTVTHFFTCSFFILAEQLNSMPSGFERHNASFCDRRSPNTVAESFPK